jgi:hypothetical protein
LTSTFFFSVFVASSTVFFNSEAFSEIAFPRVLIQPFAILYIATDSFLTEVSICSSFLSGIESIPFLRAVAHFDKSSFALFSKDICFIIMK